MVRVLMLEHQVINGESEVPYPRFIELGEFGIDHVANYLVRDFFEDENLLDNFHPKIVSPTVIWVRGDISDEGNRDWTFILQ